MMLFVSGVVCECVRECVRECVHIHTTLKCQKWFVSFYS